MDLLSAVSKLENNPNFYSRVEDVIGLNGFRDILGVTAWLVKDNVTVGVSVDDVTVADIWKCFFIEDLEGVWYLVVMRKFKDELGIRDSVDYKLFVLGDVVSFDFV